MEFSRAQELASGVPGWLSQAEAQALYRLARGCRGAGAIVEIGSWQGRSTIYLAAGSLAGPQSPIVAVDPHTGSPEHHRELGTVSTFEAFSYHIEQAGVAHLVAPRVMTSARAAEGMQDPVELVFIDGAHELDMVQLDFDLWVPKLVVGGWVALHDTVEWPGPRQVAIQRVFRSPRFRAVGYADSLVYGQKVERATPFERLANHRALVAKLVYERGRKLPLPAPVLRWGKRLVSRLAR